MKYVVIQRVIGTYEVWEQCKKLGCPIYHRMVATYKTEAEARAAAGLTEWKS